MSEENKTHQRGIIHITLPVVITIVGVVSISIGTFYASLSGASDERNDLKVVSEVNKSRIENLEVKFQSIDGKLDKLLNISE